MSGIGKTELAYGFARWFAETGGCPGGVFVSSFKGGGNGNGYEAPRTEHIAESIRVVKRSALIFALCYAMITIVGYMCLCR